MDFVALNYYSASYVSNAPGKYPGNFTVTGTKNGVALGPISGTSWQTVYGPGLRTILNFVSKTFKMDIMVTECGTSVPNEGNLTQQQVTSDTFRSNFFQSHLQALAEAITLDKIPVKAFLAWSLFGTF
jgi:beta-glucosidase/6-phospho-beta-glucosidase/beta-galactosidase